MIKKIISVLTAFFVLFSMMPAYSAYAADAEKVVSVWYFNAEKETMAPADKVELYQGGELNLSVKIKNTISGDIQWQIKAGAKTWIDIQDATEENLYVSYGMVKSLLKKDSVRMRCAVLGTGDQAYYSDPVKIIVTDENNQPDATSYTMNENDATAVAPEPMAAPVAVPADEIAPMAAGDSSEENTTIHTITIEYVYSEASQFSGQRVALPYIAEVPHGGTLSGIVTSPSCVGYNPDIDEIDLSTLGEINENRPAMVVSYSPAKVSYTVRHYQQNINDDEYTWVDTTMATGFTESLTTNEGVAKVYEGFTALEHFSEPIAADSSTMIDIYYDRDYCLMSFDLGGGNGVNPIYARYGTDISVGTPSKMGWKFVGWKTAPGDEGEFVDIPKTMPSENCKFYAVWEPIPNDTTYSVAYWVNNSDGTKTYLTTKTEFASAGDKVSGTDNISTANVCGIEEHTQHTVDCYCDKPEHAHNDSCYGKCTHKHTTECYTGDDLTVASTTGTESGAFKSLLAAVQTPREGNVYKYRLSNKKNSIYNFFYLGDTWYYLGTGDDYDSIVSGINTPNSNGSYSTAVASLRNNCHTHNSSCLSCTIQIHTHGETCRTCGKDIHTHSDDCKETFSRYLDFVEADQDVTVAGDGTTVVNVYYTYRTYTIRYIYARQSVNGGNYQLASSTSDGNIDNCSWNYSSSTLPKVVDPSGATTPTYDRIGNYNYYYISLTANLGEDISGLWPAANIGDVGSYKWGSWAAAYDTGYRQKYGNAHANIVGVYPVMSEDMIGQSQTLLDTKADGTKIYLAQNMIAWWAGSNDGVANHAYHNYFEVVGAPQEGDVTYNGKTYRLRETIVFTAAHNNTTRVDPIGYNGYTCINEDHDKQGDSKQYDNKGNCAICNKYETDNNDTCNYCNTFYYDAVKYKLSFWNHNEWLDSYEEVDIAFGTPLSGYEAEVTAQANAKYPSGLEKDVYRFVGWYTTKECYEDSRVNWSDLKMPASNLVLYAKWEPITHEVNIYITEDGEQLDNSAMQVTHGQLVPENSRPDPSNLENPLDEDAEFIGWFYRDAQGKELAFDFANMAINYNMDVYAKWRSNKMKEVIIEYIVEDENGEKAVADTETLMMRLGQTRTFDAKIGTSLYLEYRTGCFPETASHSITINEDDFKSTDPITYTFEYKRYGKVPYQVEFYVMEKDGTERPAFKVVNGKAEFVDSDTYASWSDSAKREFAASNTSVSSADQGLKEGGQYIEQHWQNNKAIVTELYVPDNLSDPTWSLPDAYLPSNLKLQKVIVPDETDPTTNIKANTIKFVYTLTDPEEDPDNPVDPDDPDKPDPVYQARYLIQYYVQDSTNPGEYVLYDYDDDAVKSGTIIEATPPAIAGYTYSYDLTKEFMDAYNSQDYRNDVEPNTLTQAPDKMTGTVTADDRLELNFYYELNSYPYQVMYLEEGTNRRLADPKTEDANGNPLTGLYGSKVTEYAIDLNGDEVDKYVVVGASTKSIYIQMEAETTANVNTIVFYYKLKSTDLIISKTVVLDEDQANESGIAALPDEALTQEFEFNVYCPTGYNKSTYDYTITTVTDEGTVSTPSDPDDPLRTLDGYNLNIKLKHGQSIRIHGLIMGEYIITEKYVPGFRITVNDGSDAQQKENVSVTAKLVEENTPVSVGFTNSYPFFTGDLVLGKTVKKVDAVNDPAATEPYKVRVTLKPHDEAREIDRVITWTDGDGTEKTYTVPAIKSNGTNETDFTFDVWVPVDGTVTLNDVPAGNFVAEEIVKGTIGYIADFYAIKTYSKLHNNEETITATGAVVNGVIHGGHPTTVNFTNTYKKGDLKIEKTVTQEYVNDSWTEDTFTFEIVGTTELPDGNYKVDNATVTVSDGVVTVKDKDGNDPTITVTRTNGVTSWSGSLSYENLPAGYYTVTETAAGLGLDKYNAAMIADPDTGLVNDTETPANFNFMNIYKRTKGSLQVGKEIRIVTSGATIDEAQPFTFVVDLKDGELTGEYACVVKDKQDNAVVEDSTTKLLVNSDGNLEFQLKHNQYILINGLPVGDYHVKEEAIEGYDSSFGDVINDPGIYSVDPAVIKTDKTTTLNCQNAYPVYYSNLIVHKQIYDPEVNSIVDKNTQDDEFAFSVSISNYSDKISLAGGIKAQFYESANDTTPQESALTVLYDTITFNLKAGEYVNLNLPAGKYTIDETGIVGVTNPAKALEDYYTTAYTVNGVAPTETEIAGGFNLLSGDRDEVVFTNTYKYLDLTIDTDCDYKGQNFIFNVSADDTVKGKVDLSVVLRGEDSQTIKNLPAGHYTVTEQNEWSWREVVISNYKIGNVTYAANDPIVLRTNSVTAEYDYAVPERVIWLSGSSYNYNLQEKGGN